MLIRGASAIMTGLSGAAARHPGPDIRVRGSRIEALGKLEPETGESCIDADGGVVYPAWVNTHHHLAESLLNAACHMRRARMGEAALPAHRGGSCLAPTQSLSRWRHAAF